MSADAPHRCAEHVDLDALAADLAERAWSRQTGARPWADLSPIIRDKVTAAHRAVAADALDHLDRTRT